MFAFVEYWVAAANMAFYWTVGSEMPNEEIVVIRFGIYFDIFLVGVFIVLSFKVRPCYLLSALLVKRL